MKQKKAGHRIRMSRGRNVKTNFAKAGASTSVVVASDENHLPAPKTNSGACSICQLTGDFIGTCLFLLCYGSSPLDKNNMECH
jgi:hypothetical protein